MTKEFDDFINRRKFARANIHALIRYFLPFSSDEEMIQTRISDISEGGTLMVTFMTKLSPETSIKMIFVMPGSKGQLTTVEGRVRHTRLLEENIYQSGIEFLHLEEKDRLSIREYVDSHPKK